MPIDNNYQIKKEESKVYPPLPKAVYQCELLEITIKDAIGKFSKEGDKNFVFQFTLLGGTENGKSLRGRNVWDNFVPTTLYIGKSGKNSLYQIVETFLGRELTREEEATGLDGKLLNSFIGKQIRLFVDHREKDGKIYDKISSYMVAEGESDRLTEKEREDATVKNKKEEKIHDNSEVDINDIFPDQG